MSISSSQKSVRLGLMPPLTGIVGIYGQEISRAGQIACDEINRAGGVMGRPLELIIEDDASLPETAVSAAEKLLDHHGCVALIGNLMTNSRIAVAHRVAEPRRIPYLCFSLYEGSILSRYYLHFAALPNQQIDFMIPHMRNEFGPRMFFCGNNYEWPRGSVDAAKKVLEKCSGRIVGEEYYPIGLDDENVERLISNLRKSEADVFVPFFAGSDEITVLRHFARSGLKSHMRVAMTHFDEIMASHLTPFERSGLFSSNSYFMNVPTDENRNYLQKLAAIPGVDGIWPHGNGILTNFGEATYICVKAFAQAVNAAQTTDQETLVDALEKVSITAPQGVVSMSQSIHHAHVHAYLAECQPDGSFNITRDFGSVVPVIPERYRHQLTSPGCPFLDLENIRLESRIVSQMSDAVCLIHAQDNSIVYVNPGFERMIGYNKADICTKTLSFLLLPGLQNNQVFIEEINRLLYLKGLWRGELQIRHADGSIIWCAIAISAFTHSRYGEVWLANMSDITGRKVADDATRAAKHAAEKAQLMAEEASRAKDQFLAVLSHELRTPLSPILTGISILEDMLETDDKCLDVLKVMRRNVDLESHLIDDLLDLTRIARGLIKLKKNRVNIQEMMARAVEVCRTEIDQKKIHLQIPQPSQQPLWIDADPERFQQVLWNLLKNAIKFTPALGHIEMRVRQDSPDYVLFEIQDDGIGIEPANLERIFSVFEQADSSIAPKFGGLGLGLAISHGLVEMHGGTIKAHSMGKNQGATFGLKMPVWKSKSIKTLEKDTVCDPQSRHAMHVLFVEDHLDSAELYRMMLTRKGHQVTIASSVQEALNLAVGQTFDLLITDLGLPDGKGYEILASLKKSGKDCPAIVLSGFGQQEDIRRSLEAGFIAHLTKPVLFADLHRLIENISSKKSPNKSPHFET